MAPWFMPGKRSQPWGAGRLSPREQRAQRAIYGRNNWGGRGSSRSQAQSRKPKGGFDIIDFLFGL